MTKTSIEDVIPEASCRPDALIARWMRAAGVEEKVPTYASRELVRVLDVMLTTAYDYGKVHGQLKGTKEICEDLRDTLDKLVRRAKSLTPGDVWENIE